MKAAAILIFLISLSLAASCPLGFPPENACASESPSCALFTDGDGDNLCDNPGPQTVEIPEPEEEELPEDTTQTETDFPEIETFPETDSLTEEAEEEIAVPDDTLPAQEVTVVIPEEEETVDTSSMEPEPVPEDTVNSGNRIIILSDAEGDPFCVNPEDRRQSVHFDIVWELSERLTDSSTITEEIQVELSRDSVYIDTITTEKFNSSVSTCPLGYLPEQACHEDNPSCTLFTDVEGDSFCDNPGIESDSSSSVSVNVSGVTYSLVPLASGCPLGLPPEAACPTSDDRLCPHYKGWDGCTNPSGGGLSRTLIVLIATAVLLPVATMLKRKLQGNEERRKRKIAHIAVQLASLLVLGFFVQGCFCPLGAMQYSLLPGGLIFLGGLGIAVLILPIIWTIFFDRIYCGWVCPFGALQDLLGKLNVPRPPRFSHKVHTVLSGVRFLLAALFFGFLILATTGQFSNLVPEAFFCRFDPFHSIFSFFLVGSFTAAVAAACFLLFFPRFFCKYLCFYGAILSFLGRTGLWNRITRKHTHYTRIRKDQ
jgi:hypothetical protein